MTASPPHQQPTGERNPAPEGHHARQDVSGALRAEYGSLVAQFIADFGLTLMDLPAELWVDQVHDASWSDQ